MHEEVAHQWQQPPQPRLVASSPIEHCQFQEIDIRLLYSVVLEVQQDYVSEGMIGMLGSYDPHVCITAYPTRPLCCQ